MADQKPLIIFPQATESIRKTGKFFPNRPVFPSRGRQTERLEPKMQRIRQAFEHQRMTVKRNASGTLPEQTLVLETADNIQNFTKAVAKIHGLEWLLEWEEKFEADDDFHYTKKKTNEKDDKKVDGRLFLVMSDQRAIAELKRLWEKYKNNADFEPGLAPMKHLFTQLKDIRLWDIRDRLAGTGIEDEWLERLKAGKEIIRFEIELWYRKENQMRQQASSNVRQLVHLEHGKIINEVMIPGIQYHALLVEAPISIFNNLAQNTEVQLIRSEHVMFFRPTGQAMISIPEEDINLEKTARSSVEPTIPSLPPYAALLDGVPLQNHSLLKDLIIIDDPDGHEQEYEPHERIHATTMASLILHGELDENNPPSNRPLYVRPIMKPDYRDWLNEARIECIPENSLPVDLVHRAVVRMFDGENGDPPTAPSVKVINLSIGDTARSFDFILSPWAKLIDWLSFKYKVLFIVSAGNQIDNIVLKANSSKSSSQISSMVLAGLLETANLRRILSPAESLNALTIGAIHHDYSGNNYNLGNRVDLMSHFPMISPTSRIGLGYRRAVKPDVLFNGGRQLYMQNMLTPESFTINKSLMAPGQKVAFPKKQGDLETVAYTRGTSNATALATRTAIQVYEKLLELNENNTFENDLMAVLIKTLLTHGASWGEMRPILEQNLKKKNDQFRDRVAPRFIGYGAVDVSRIFDCTSQRVTLIGAGRLTKDKTHIYKVPLPPSLSSKTVWKRLTVTLGWFTPTNCNDQKYRCAHLAFSPPKDELILKRTDVDDDAVKRGTLQHEILEGSKASAFVDGDDLVIEVSCREDAGGLVSNGPIPYGLSVSLEVKEGVDIEIYEEVSTRVRPRIRSI